MNYEFPFISHISDVLPHIEGAPEFVVAERDHYTVINYVVSMSDTFPPVMKDGIYDLSAAMRRECRGLVFGKDGRVIARRFSKFFNVNEKDETQVHKIDMSRPHIILDKLDGSMITPIPVEGAIRWGTKMGITEVAMQAEVFVATAPIYREFARYCIQKNMTPIFEWCSRKQRIVLDYPEDQLILLAIRENDTGAYYKNWENLATLYCIPTVKSWGSLENLEDFIRETRVKEDIEGYVIRFDDGHMVKIKADLYVQIHGAKDKLSHEKNVIEMILDNRLDDVIPYLPVEDSERLMKYSTDVLNGIGETKFWIKSYILGLIREKAIDRKTFALEYTKDLNPVARSIMFSVWDTPEDMLDTEIWDNLTSSIRKNLGSQPKVDDIRVLWGKAKWVR